MVTDTMPPRVGEEGPQPSPRLRCAIYTRKSTEEGLNQEFNFAGGAERRRPGVHCQSAAARVDVGS